MIQLATLCSPWTFMFSRLDSVVKAPILSMCNLCFMVKQFSHGGNYSDSSLYISQKNLLSLKGRSTKQHKRANNHTLKSRTWPFSVHTVHIRLQATYTHMFAERWRSSVGRGILAWPLFMKLLVHFRYGTLSVTTEYLMHYLHKSMVNRLSAFMSVFFFQPLKVHLLLWKYESKST